jgi:hypothetical protein
MTVPAEDEEGSMTAYVLIQTEALGVPVAHKLRTIPGIVSADNIHGAYDAIAVARSGSTAEVVEDIVEPIRRLPGVTRAIVAPLNDQGTRQPEFSRDEAA